MQVHTSSVPGTRLINNWSLNTTKKAFRFDSSSTTVVQGDGNGTLLGNVGWRTGGFMVKNDNHHIESNLAYDSRAEWFQASTQIPTSLVRSGASRPFFAPLLPSFILTLIFRPSSVLDDSPVIRRRKR